MRKIFSGLVLLSLVLGSEVTASADSDSYSLKTESISDYVIVDSSGQGNYNSLQDAIAAHEHRIYIKDGTYLLSQNLRITYNDVDITGESKDGVIIRQTNSNDDGLWIGSGASNITVSNLTLDAKTYQSNSMFTVSGASNVTLKDTKVLGSDNNFAVYFAGKPYPNETTLTEFNQGNMDEHNELLNNDIFSTWDGDVLSFSLQRYGVLKGNTVHGGRIAYYMNRDSTCSGNTILDSSSEGIYISIPALNNTIEDNVILRPKNAGIRVKIETEHPVTNPDDYRAQYLTIRHNDIEDSRLFGMAIENVANSQIENNTITRPDLIGIWMIRTDSMSVQNNLFNQWGLAEQRGNYWGFQTREAAIYEEVANSTSQIAENKLLATSGNEKHGIVVNSDGNSKNNEVKNNQLLGSLPNPFVKIATGAGSQSNNIISSN